MEPFESLLASSADAQGHLCPGQVVGVRMAMLGCRLERLGKNHLYLADLAEDEIHDH
ncbi:MAG: FmdE family protein [Syntrophobacteraceae bacterium]|jgi:formylmethanofuran dehydrogenase subunit E|nr:FmdE family protein [Syntrophobacteraceae bacterium]